MEGSSTRQRLIDSAYVVFTEKGYHDASIRDIAKHAGITSGLVHYHFKSKQELLIAVQSMAQNKYHGEYDDTVASVIAVSDQLQRIKCRVLDNPDWYRWRYELYSLGMKSDELRSSASKVLDDGRVSLVHQLRQAVHKNIDVDSLAAVLIACFDGLALQKIVDESFDLDKAYIVLTEVIETYFIQMDKEGNV